MASQELFYLGSEEIVEAGGSLRFKLTDYVFHDEDAAVLPEDTGEELFYAHDRELGFLVVRSKFAEDGRFWYDTLSDRLVKLDKPTESIRRITIVKAVQENPSGPLDSADWEFSAGKVVHYVTSEDLVDESPRSLYILDTAQLETLMKERNLTWKRKADKERLRKSGFNHLTDISSNRGISKPPEESPINGSEKSEQIEKDPQVKIRQVKVQIDEISSDIYEIINLHYLLVRFGINEWLEQNPAKDDKETMKIRNEIYSVDANYREQNQTLEANVPLRVHRDFPTEFKLFVDVEDPDQLEEVKEAFAVSPSCGSASISDSLEDRVYFSLKRFGITETPEGFINNVIYPK